MNLKLSALKRLVQCLVLALSFLPANAFASFMGIATFSSVPPGARLEPVQILIDDNLSGGVGLVNIVDNNSSPTQGYFIVCRGTSKGIFPWIKNFRYDGQLTAQKIVKFKDRYIVLYTAYNLAGFANGAYLMQLDAATGNTISNTRLVLDNAEEITGVDIHVSEMNAMVYAVCNGKLGTQEVNLLAAYDIGSNSIMDARIIEYNGRNIHADALAGEPSSIGANDRVHIGGRMRKADFYEGVYVQAYTYDFSTKQLNAQTHNVFQWSDDNRLFMSRLKYQPSTGHLVMMTQSFGIRDEAGSFDLFQVDVAGSSIVQRRHFPNPGRMFLSDINMEEDHITIAGPNNWNNTGAGTVIALFNQNLDFVAIKQYPFNGFQLEPTALHGPHRGFPFVMATQNYASPNTAKWTVGWNYDGACDVIDVRLEEGFMDTKQDPLLQEIAISSDIKKMTLLTKNDKLIYDVECGKPGQKQGTTSIENTNSGMAYNFQQNEIQVHITSQCNIGNAEMYDINGRKIATYPSAGTSLSISKKDITPGVYVLRFAVNGLDKTEKIIVQ